MIRRTPPILLAAALLCGAWGCNPSTPSAEIQPHECREITARMYKVERIVDGDTFKVRYDGEQTSVRIAATVRLKRPGMSCGEGQWGPEAP